ncbi:MAG: hypothetical protein P8H31_00330 [Porticoccaceae bacterium]|nr:hypothetical protein [Porticoccaceae bacterium]
MKPGLGVTLFWNLVQHKMGIGRQLFLFRWMPELENGGSNLTIRDTESNPLYTIDIDGNNQYDALSDGLLLLRALFGLEGQSLTAGAISPDAVYTESSEIKSRIDSLGDLADIDGNGTVNALTDGLLTLRYLLGLEGDTLINGVIEIDAIRKSASEIEAHIKTLMPPL